MNLIMNLTDKINLTSFRSDKEKVDVLNRRYYKMLLVLFKSTILCYKQECTA